MCVQNKAFMPEAVLPLNLVFLIPENNRKKNVCMLHL